jgi:Xaa-Pro aminopeptidase
MFSAITPEDYLKRIDETKSRMRDRNLDLLVVYSDAWRSANCRYLTGVKPYTGFLTLGREGYDKALITIPLEGSPTLFAWDSMLEWVKIGVCGTLKERPWIDIKPWTRAKVALKELSARAKKVGYEGKNITPWPVYEYIKEAVGSKIEDTDVLELQRMIKGEKEIKLMEVASNINDRICEDLVRGIVRYGVTEKEVQRKMEASGHSMGAEYVDANFMISRDVGWGYATDRTIMDGDLLSLHVVLQYEGYSSDNDRVMGFGHIKKEEEELAEIVRKAFWNGLKAMKPGIKGSDACKAANDTHEFVTTHGHGIGLEGEELGRIGDWTLQEGMTFTYAPYAYNKDIGATWGTEDIIVVTENGARTLTKFPIDYVIR